MNRLYSRLNRKLVVIAAALATAAGVACSSSSASTGKSGFVAPDATVALSDSARDLGPPSKLSPELQRLESSADSARDLGNDSDNRPSPLEVGYPIPGTANSYEVAIHVTPDVDVKALKAAGASVFMQLGDVIYAGVPAQNLTRVSEVAGVVSINPIPATTLPQPPKGNAETPVPIEGARDLTGDSNGADKFDHGGLTGKGVIVGIVDTGIDWRHGDFRNPDGTSRILYIWDPFDDSYKRSGGKVGMEPPFKNPESGDPLGTVYNNAQINAAIQGKLDIARTDEFGHGTACAGTAAGNGLGTGGTVPAGTYMGVAPEADLIIVSAAMPGDEGGGIHPLPGTLGPAFIMQKAAELHRPCSISLSWGGHDSPHDGSDEQEQAFDKLLNHGDAPGVVICVSAGNDGQNVIHARGRFGPKIANEFENGAASPVQMIVSQKTALIAFFDSKDDWALSIIGLDQFLVGYDKEPGNLTLLTKGGVPNILCSPNVSESIKPYVAEFGKPDSNMAVGHLPDGRDVALIENLPPGKYYVIAHGASEHVTHGAFDLYLPRGGDASFGQGGDHRMVVAAPGTADSVICVGSYVFRRGWDSLKGHSGANLELGSLSDYSSPGFRSDGVVKPDIASPGQFMISSMANGCVMSREAGPASAQSITPDGKHIAWCGTSASCPFTAGVVALMLEKNPNLTENQIKKILRSTADSDPDTTGAVPNSEWGYGKLSPVKALAAVTAAEPAPSTQPTVTPPSPAIQPTFAGSFQGDGIAIELIANNDGTYSGTVTRGDLRCPLTARVVAGQLEGTFRVNGQDFTFTATLNGDQLTLQTGSKSHTLTRQITQPHVDAAWSGRALRLPANLAHATLDNGGMR